MSQRILKSVYLFETIKNFCYKIFQNFNLIYNKYNPLLDSLIDDYSLLYSVYINGLINSKTILSYLPNLAKYNFNLFQIEEKINFICIQIPFEFLLENETSFILEPIDQLQKLINSLNPKSPKNNFDEIELIKMIFPIIYQFGLPTNKKNLIDWDSFYIHFNSKYSLDLIKKYTYELIYATISLSKDINDNNILISKYQQIYPNFTPIKWKEFCLIIRLFGFLDLYLHKIINSKKIYISNPQTFTNFPISWWNIDCNHFFAKGIKKYGNKSLFRCLIDKEFPFLEKIPFEKKKIFFEYAELEKKNEKFLCKDYGEFKILKKPPTRLKLIQSFFIYEYSIKESYFNLKSMKNIKYKKKIINYLKILSFGILFKNNTNLITPYFPIPISYRSERLFQKEWYLCEVHHIGGIPIFVVSLLSNSKIEYVAETPLKAWRLALKSNLSISGYWLFGFFEPIVLNYLKKNFKGNSNFVQLNISSKIEDVDYFIPFQNEE